MKRQSRTVSAWVLVALLTCSMLTAGCEPLGWFGPNFNVYTVIPLGLGGSPGLLNPFGIVQAVVNALLGMDAGGGGGSQAYVTPQPPAPVNPAIPVVVGG